MDEDSKQKNCSIAGTLMIIENNKVFNRLVWISEKGEIHTYDKHHLFSLIKEERYISKGEGRLIIELEGWKICPLICYDLLKSYGYYEKSMVEEEKLFAPI